MEPKHMEFTEFKRLLFVAAAGLLIGAAGPADAQTPLGGAGPRPVAVLLCRYADKPNTYGFTPTAVLGMWTGNTFTSNGTTVDNSISGLVDEVSNGTVNFQGTQAFGWYTLPKPLSGYETGDAAGNDCIAAAQQNGANLRIFPYVAVYVNDQLPDAQAKTWTATLPGPPSPTMWNAMIMNHRGLTSPPLVLHELGHVLSDAGWHTDSASDPLGLAAYYGDSVLTDQPPYDTAMATPSWDASRRLLMGFVPAGSIAKFTGTTQTYNISRLTQPFAGLPTVIEVPLPGGAKYVISARTRVGHDALRAWFNYSTSALSAEGVRIELFTSTTVDAKIQMSKPGGDRRSTDAVWLTGQSFMDTVNGITITVANFNPTGNPTAQIMVSSGLSGNYRLLSQSAPGMCLDVHAAGGSGSKVQIWTCTGGGNQSFNFVSQGGGVYLVKPSYDAGLCLDVNGAGTSPGTNVGIWTCNGGSHQKWTVNSVGGTLYELAPQHVSTFRMDVNGAGTASGTQIIVWPTTGASNQRWVFTK